MYTYKGFAFHHIPKTGGTSIKRMLLDTELPFGNTVEVVHIPLSEQRKELLKYKTIYTNIRNPYDRIVSLYAYNRLRRKFGIPEDSFNDFFHNYWYLNPEKSPWLFSVEEYLLVDGVIPENVKIIKLEDMAHTWPTIIEKHFNKKISKVPRENYTLHGEPLEYFDDEMIKKVQEKESWVLKFYTNLPKGMRMEG